MGLNDHFKTALARLGRNENGLGPQISQILEIT